MKNRVRSITKQLIKNGSIVLPMHCQDCGGDGPFDIHHNNYSDARDVERLCLTCHEKRHSVGTLNCIKCGYSWLARKEEVIACPDCKSRDWDGNGFVYTSSGNELKCKKCGYEWEARKEKPKACPECKSRKWNKE